MNEVLNVKLEPQDRIECFNGLDGFIAATSLYLEQPHLVNRSLRSSITLFEITGHDVAGGDVISHVIENFAELAEHERHHILQVSLKMWQSISVHKTEDSQLYLRQLLPRSLKFKPIYKLILKTKRCVSFIPALQSSEIENSSFELKYESDEIILYTPKLSTKARWLSNALLPKLSKWSKVTECTSSPSLNLIDVALYAEKYNELKLKYGIELCKNWPGSCSQKFVYEDIGIATYLLLLWEKERQTLGLVQKQSFLDLGCGNGLLVYLLSKEGHPGAGIDVRQRKTWELFKDCKLEESAIIPSSDLVYPGIDWFIGNHSDELTPWIPVLARLSSLNTRVFLLPCCHYDFMGKYMRADTRMSHYNEYQTYLKHLCEYLGFKVCTDRLKIPSTKRRCLICYCSESYTLEVIQSRVITLLLKKNAIKMKGDDDWEYIGKIREENTGVARNCTQLNPVTVQTVVKDCFQYLLSFSNPVDIIKDNKTVPWNLGTFVPLYELVALFPDDILQEMKQQCGGMKTLLKNHGHIFKIFNGGVQLRKPSATDKSKLKCNWKKKNCWFAINHPQGCPLETELCSFIHPVTK